MIYRLLALNIDGTILLSNGKLDKSVKDAVKFVQDKGVIVTLVTSRNFNFAKRIARSLKIKNIIISHHGAFIASSVDQALFVKRIEENILRDLVQVFESLQCRIQLIHEKTSVTNHPNKTSLLSRTIIEPTNRSTYKHQYVYNLSEYLQQERLSPTHMEVFFSTKQDALEAKQLINNLFFEVAIYQDGYKLVVVPNGVSKLSGLLYALNHWNITLKETVVIGSDFDDLEMIQAAGLGVAMGNSPEQVKAASDWVTRTNDNQGVSYMVKENFRKQQPISFLEKMNLLKEK